MGRHGTNKQEKGRPTPSKSEQEGSFNILGIAPALLFAAGIAMGVGYIAHLAGFSGWVTLVIAGASLFVAGGLWGDGRRFALLAGVVALIGAAMCTTALPAQFDNREVAAAAANVGVIVSQLGATLLIWRIRANAPRTPLALS